jgi:adenylyl-sulfate kinase
MLQGDHLLGLLYGARGSQPAMTLEIQDWKHREASNVLIVQPGGDKGVRARWLDGGPTAMPLVTYRRIWFQPPSRIRVEILEDGTVVRAAVRDGAAWWRWDLQDGETAGDIRAGAALPRLLDPLQVNPVRVLSTLWLEVTREDERIFRPVLHARGTPRDPFSSDDRHTEFAFDAEHGTPLYIATYEAGARTSAADTQSIDYSEIDPAIFRFEIASDSRDRTKTQGHTPAAPARATNVDRLSLPDRQSVLTDYQTIWLTGIPGAGKTTIARAVERLLRQLGIQCCVLDGDELRRGLSNDLGLSRQDRSEQARRVAHVAAVLADSGIIPIVALVSPYSEDRARAREIHEANGVGFMEVWVETPVAVCAGRDPKGLYAANARAGTNEADGSGLTGVSAPYEAPTNCELTVSGDGPPPRVAAAQIVEELLSTARTSRVVTTR